MYKNEIEELREERGGYTARVYFDEDSETPDWRNELITDKYKIHELLGYVPPRSRYNEDGDRDVYGEYDYYGNYLGELEVDSQTVVLEQGDDYIKVIDYARRLPLWKRYELIEYGGDGMDSGDIAVFRLASAEIYPAEALIAARGFCEEYTDWLRGYVFDVVIDGPDGETVDSVGGLYGVANAIETRDELLSLLPLKDE